MAIGIALGCVAALAAGRLLAAQIWAFHHDPPSFGVVIVLLLVVGFQACLWPARRAAKVDPMVSLRPVLTGSLERSTSRSCRRAYN